MQPGVVLDHLRNAAEKYHLTFAPDPATHDRCTIGGMIGNNSCGVHSVMAGKTDDNIEELEVVTYDGVRMKVGQNFIHGATDAFVRPVHEAAMPVWRRTHSSVQPAQPNHVGTAAPGCPAAPVWGRTHSSVQAAQIHRAAATPTAAIRSTPPSTN